eukprot:scaffold55338_cov32-Tisochrysis_lutea.AAC.1
MEKRQRERGGGGRGGGLLLEALVRKSIYSDKEKIIPWKSTSSLYFYCRNMKIIMDDASNYRFRHCSLLANALTRAHEVLGEPQGHPSPHSHTATTQ